MKTCSLCKKNLPFKLFYTDQSKKDGLGSKCKECAKSSSKLPPKNPTRRKQKRKEWEQRNKEVIADYQRKYRSGHRESTREYNRNYKRTKAQKHRLSVYGITQEMFDKMMEKQNKSCGMCTRPFQGKTVVAQIDHCHKTGRVRGLLCMSCNLRLGFLESEPLREQARKYLQCEIAEIRNKES